MMTTDSSSPEPSHQRRIGERYPIRVPMQWGPLTLKRRKATTPLIAGATTNVSLLGIAFETPTQSNISRGSTVVITMGRTSCLAAVRSIRPSEKASHSVFGVEFHDPSMIEQAGDVIGRSGYNRRLTSDFSSKRVRTRSDNQHYFDRLTSRSGSTPTFSR